MKKLSILLCFVLLSTNLIGQLRYRFNPGQEVAITQTFDLQVLQNINNSDVNMTTVLTTDLMLEVVEVSGNTAKIKGVYKFIGMNLKMKMMGTEMDIKVVSNAEPDMPEMIESYRMFKSIINIPFFIYLKHNGHVVKTEGLENLSKRMREVTTDIEAIKEIESNFAAEKLRSDFAKMFANYPNSSLQVGTKWKSMLTLEELGIKDKEQIWAVDAINYSKNQMEISSFMEGLKMTNFDKKAETNLSGELSTYFMVDMRTGWPEQMTLSSEMTGMALGKGDLEGMSWPMQMKIKSITSYELQ